MTVTFFNDAYNKELSEDSNLCIDSASINGVAISGTTRALYAKGSIQFVASIVLAAGAPPSTPAADTAHESFDFSRGEGHIVLSDFSAKGEGADVVRLLDYSYSDHKLAAGVASYTSYADLLPHISQQGADTVITLSATDAIRLKNVEAADLGADNFRFLSEVNGALGGYTSNGWIVFNNGWGSDSLTYGKDYTISTSYDPAMLAGGTTFSWSYPPPSVSWAKVMAYPSIMFGSVTYDNIAGEYDPAHVLPVRIADLKGMTGHYDLSYGGDTGGFDVAYDIWLTSKADGKYADITNEVMIWLHQGDLQPYGVAVGAYSDDAYSATIYHTGTYTALIPDKEYSEGDIDVGAILLKLKHMGIISGREYLNQIDLGAEPIKGTGYLTVNGLSYGVQSVGDGCILKTSHADGGVTSVTLQGISSAASIATLTGGE